MKATRKGKVRVRVMKLSFKRYEEIRKELLGTYGKHKPVFMPHDDALESIMVRAFLREGKWVTLPVERYVCDDRELSLFKFNSSYVVTEKVGSVFTFNCRRDIDSRFRMLLLNEMMVKTGIIEKERSFKRSDDPWIEGDKWITGRIKALVKEDLANNT